MKLHQVLRDINHLLFYAIFITLLSLYLSESTEHSSHGLVVEAFGAVDDNHVHAKSLTKIFDRLSLSGAGRAFGATTSMEVEGSGQSHVASEGERGERDRERTVEQLRQSADQSQNGAAIIFTIVSCV